MVFEIKLGDSLKKIDFNIFCTMEMGKIFEVDPTPENIKEKIVETNEQNSLLMFKVLIYCGIIGNDYKVGFKKSITQEEVGEMLANVSADELIDIFNKFSEEMGFNIKAEEDIDVGDEKKN